MESNYDSSTGIMSWKFTATNTQMMVHSNLRDFGASNYVQPESNRTVRIPAENNRSQNKRHANNQAFKRRNQGQIPDLNPYAVNDNAPQEHVNRANRLNQRNRAPINRGQKNRGPKNRPQNRRDLEPKQLNYNNSLGSSDQNNPAQNRLNTISNQPTAGEANAPPINQTSTKRLRNKIRRLKQKLKKSITAPSSNPVRQTEPLITFPKTEMEDESDDLIMC